MEGISISAGQGAVGMQAGMGTAGMNGAQQAPPPPAPVDSAARSAGMQAEGKGQKLDVVA